MSTNIDPAGDRAELIVSEPGAISICLVAEGGEVAGVTRLHVSGPAGLVTRMELPLSVSDGAKTAALVPVVVFQSNGAQMIRVMGRDHAEAAVARAEALGWAPEVDGPWRSEWERREREYWAPRPRPGSAD